MKVEDCMGCSQLERRKVYRKTSAADYHCKLAERRISRVLKCPLEAYGLTEGRLDNEP